MNGLGGWVDALTHDLCHLAILASIELIRRIVSLVPLTELPLYISQLLIYIFLFCDIRYYCYYIYISCLFVSVKRCGHASGCRSIYALYKYNFIHSFIYCVIVLDSMTRTFVLLLLISLSLFFSRLQNC